ncbi:hypothetical protein GQ53DRAFT_876083 [Thozetella sp. PMI_491]|nr:hypothetical protein GQ53DRAFT_876083 [Thozetella sp. PMI_491]
MATETIAATSKNSGQFNVGRHRRLDRPPGSALGLAYLGVYNFHVSSISFQNFLPTVIQGLGYGNIISLVLTFPPYFYAAIMTVVIAYSSGRFNERTWYITVYKCIVIVGFTLAAATLNIAARLFGVFLFAGFTFRVNNIILGWVSATSDKQMKRRR